MASIWTVIGLSGLVSSLFITIIYFLGNLFSSDFLKAWSKKELSDLISSIVIFILLVPILDFLLEIYDPAGLENGFNKVFINPLINSILFLVKMIYYFTLVSTFNLNYSLGLDFNKILDIAGASSPISEGFSSTTSLYPGYGTNILLNQMYVGVDFSLNLIFLLKSIVWLYSFLNYLIFNYLLGFGIFLRIFPLTKKAGGFVIAFSLAVAYIFPFACYLSFGLSSLVISKAVSSNFIPNNLNHINIEKFNVPTEPEALLYPIAILNIARDETIANIIGRIVNAFAPGAGGFTFDKVVGTGVARIVQIVLNLLQTGVPIVYSFVLSSKIPSADYILNNFYVPSFNFVLPFLSLYILLGFLSVIFQLTFTLVFAKQLANFFGQEGQLYALYRLL